MKPRCDLCDAYGVITPALCCTATKRTEFAGSFLPCPRTINYCGDCLEVVEGLEWTGDIVELDDNP